MTWKLQSFHFRSQLSNLYLINTDLSDRPQGLRVRVIRTTKPLATCHRLKIATSSACPYCPFHLSRPWYLLPLLDSQPRIVNLNHCIAEEPWSLSPSPYATLIIPTICANPYADHGNSFSWSQSSYLPTTIHQVCIVWTGHTSVYRIWIDLGYSHQWLLVHHRNILSCWWNLCYWHNLRW